MDEVEFQQVESEEQKEEAGSFIREYLEWLNDRRCTGDGVSPSGEKPLSTKIKVRFEIRESQ